MSKVRSQVTPVFWASAAITLAFVLWAVLSTETFSRLTGAAREFVVVDFGWLYLIATTTFLLFVVGLAFSRYGKIKIGHPDDQPEFGRFSWFAMLFQAGMGIGLVFWAVSEPLSHYSQPPYGLVPPYSVPAADLALRYAFFHWALHPWAVYAAIALAIAYFNFRRDEPGLVSRVFRPVLGDRVEGPIGQTIDVLAIIATLFGVAVSLGLGTLQITSGLSTVFDIPAGSLTVIAVLAITGVAYLLSASTGIQHGVKWLSNASMVVAAVLLAYFLVAGPTVLQLNTLTQGTGGYVADLVPMSFRLNAFQPGDSWAGEWTLFYWATWIGWSPFVGMFIARISRGRSIREFVVAVLAVPSLVSFVWFAVFGATAIDLDRRLQGALSRVAQQDEAQGMFVFLAQFPFSTVLAVTVILLVLIFFVAGADAACIVLGRMSAGGVLDPARPVKLVWGVAVAVVTGVLLLLGPSGLDGLQQASLLAALPFTFILLAMCWALWRALREEVPEEEIGDPTARTSFPSTPTTMGDAR
jgi:glycine betaine transporter